MAEENSYKRETAKYAKISELNSSEYVKQEGWTPNYLDTEFGKVSRVNLYGTITVKEPRRIIIDDSTGEIEIRSFEEIVCDADVGDTINVIGRPREFNERIYIMPELISKVNNIERINYVKTLLDLRKKINTKAKKIDRKKPSMQQASFDKFEPKRVVIEESISNKQEIIEEQIVMDSETPATESEPQSILDLINEMDSGDGVYVDEIISKLNVKDCEKKLNRLLEKGDIFEVKPGKVKVL
ncbi:hypothetical protein JXM83_06375 [Candidatus Woesearchaeota archaeon]|nr:hypothetical protein [Candidatus Woesearchaeota archaeon]